MADLVIVPAEVRIVRLDDVGMLPDGPANEAITAGMPVRIDATTGKYTPGNGTDATEGAIKGVACNTATIANMTLTVMKLGILDVGEALAAMAYGAPVYASDTDGTLADSAGTVSKVIGYVVPGWGATTADKLLAVAVAP